MVDYKIMPQIFLVAVIGALDTVVVVVVSGRYYLLQLSVHSEMSVGCSHMH